MADENTNQIPQNAIPPKAVPPSATRPVPETDVPALAGGVAGETPTVRRQAIPPSATAAPSSAPRTVRLKPIQAPVPGGAASSSLPPVSPSASVGSAEASDAIKRMTARIAMMTGSEAAEPQTASKSTAPLASTGILDGVDDKAHPKKTSRISLPGSTAVIAAVADTPKTIKIRPMQGPQPVTAGIAPEAVPAAAPRQNSSLASQAAAKSKTSRIPLESAMLGEHGRESAGIPKTIKLKRPGEMSSAKVSLPGATTASAASESSDSASITQKKTIRVKRPLIIGGGAPAGTEGAVSTGDGATAPAPILSPVLLAPPERGTGWFVALAALGIVVTIGLVLIFSAQTFAPNSWTRLDQQFNRG